MQTAIGDLGPLREALEATRQDMGRMTAAIEELKQSRPKHEAAVDSPSIELDSDTTVTEFIQARSSEASPFRHIVMPLRTSPTPALPEGVVIKSRLHDMEDLSVQPPAAMRNRGQTVCFASDGAEFVYDYDPLSKEDGRWYLSLTCGVCDTPFPMAADASSRRAHEKVCLGEEMDAARVGGS